MVDSEKSHDKHTRRCPRLGGPIDFKYCRSCGKNAGMCWKVIDCWWEYFDIQAYLEAHLPPEQIEALTQARPQPKIMSLVDLIEQAKSR